MDVRQLRTRRSALQTTTSRLVVGPGLALPLTRCGSSTIPTGLNVASADNSAGLAVINQPLTIGGLYVVKTINLSAGPVAVWTAATPLVSKVNTMLTTIFAMMMGVAAVPRTPNACEVLSARDVAKVQGAKFTSAKLTEMSAHSMKVSQCFYALPLLSDSVTVDLIRGDVRTFWKQHFANVRDDDDDVKPVANRSSEPDAHARRVGGIGDAAVWSGNRLAGALYVLKGETVLRVSVGGGGTQEQKIEKSKKLAERALRKL